MLKLSRMELTGFKSFYQKTQLAFPGGITAVVGPNGCGKSNISDAIAWVLGEQSHKALRGTKMEDVIFNGSAKRGPLPMAEVSLELTWVGPGAPGNGAGGNGGGPDAEAAALGGIGSGTNGAGGNGHAQATLGPGNLPGGNGRIGGGEAAASLDEGTAVEASVAAERGDAEASGGDSEVPTPEAGDAGDNDEQYEPPRFSLPCEDGASVSVTRRLYRNGDSDYRINGTRCRLKDVQNLLRAASIGARTYAVIEQDRIQGFLSARPKERKELIEEAAGILGFKARKRSALLKLQSTEVNLARIRDLVAEVARQVNSLKRQAAKARRYRRTAEEIRRLRRILFHLESSELLARLETITGAARTVLEAEAAATAASGARDARVEALRQRIEEEGRGAGERRETLHARERAVDRLEASVAALTERVREAGELSQRRDREAEDLERRAGDAAGERQRLQAEVESAGAELQQHQADLARLEESYTARLAAVDEAAREAEEHRNRLLAAVAAEGETRNREAQLAERMARLAKQRERLTGEMRSCKNERDQIGGRLEGSTERLRQDSVALEAAEESCLAAGRARDAAIHGAEDAREALEAARRELSTWEEREAALAALWHTQGDAADGPEAGALGEGIEVDPEWETAAGALLEPLLKARVVADAETAVAVIEQVHKTGSGRIRVVSRDLLAAGESVGGTLSEILKGSGQPRLLATAAGDPELVADLPTAIERWRQEPGRSYLTPGGDVIDASGVISGGGVTDGGLLIANRQRREAAEAASRCRGALPGLEAALVVARRIQEEAEATCERTRREREALAQEGLARRMVHERHGEDLERLVKRGAVLQDEERALAAEESQLRDETSEAASRKTAAQATKKQSEEVCRASQGGLDGLRDEVQVLAGERAEKKSVCAARQEALLSGQAAVTRLEKEAAEHTERARLLRAEAEELRQRGEAQKQESANLRQSREAELRQAMSLRELCRADEMTLQESRGALVEAEKEARTARQVLDEARQRVQEKELEKARAEADSDHLAKTCREEFGCAPLDLAADLADEDRERGADEVRGEVTRLEEIKERIGPVNMMAMDQFAEVEEREKYLASQQGDLEESILSLQATIQKINRTSEERFMHALEAIRTEFNRIFRELFKGGVADIVLDEPDDVLESGIEIIAQPPGKRTRNINLLSGGEKALSAIALLFAIFKYRPSPFCLLDEVDAPLDEANVDRFTRLLREYGKETQFILITHNRRSMEAANAMYGVTMGEPGISQTVSMTLAEA